MGRDILILRDGRESWRRCSLAPLRGMDGVRFVTHHPDRTLDAEGRILLEPGAPVLQPGEPDGRLLVLDSSWRRLPKLRARLVGDVRPRSLPALVTAYPRRSETFPDPASGLATIEALYAARLLLGEDDRELLQGYRFAEEFLERNPLLTS